MPSESDRGSHNAFTAEFLNRLDEAAEPDGAHEADVAGPWAIRPVLYDGGTGFAVLREWESLDDGDVPYAIFRRRETALLAAAVLPATGREPLFRLATEPDAAGFPLHVARMPDAEPVESAPADDAQTSRSSRPSHPSSPSKALWPVEPAGHLRDFDEALAGALNLAAALVRSPMSLAALLQAAGYVALEQAGRVLHRRIR
jgi:hypothetical protein